MLRNHLVIAWRNFLRHKAYALISISGLGIGMACCILVGFYVQHELSYDRFHAKADRIYRLVYPTEPRQLAPLAPLLEAEFPEVEQAVRTGFSWGAPWLSRGDIEIQHQVYTVDEGFFELFDFSCVRGNPQTALSRPNTMIISTEMARYFFGARNPVGEILAWNDGWDFEITGVFERPRNTHFPFHFLINAFVEGGHLQIKQELWSARGGEWFTYLLLPDGYDTTGFGARVNALIEKYAGPRLLPGWLKKEGQVPYLQPLTDIHLKSDFYLELKPGGDARQVAVLAIVAVMALIIACINYANLATARARTRAREVGVRRAVGGTRRQLTAQFLGESVLQSLLAMAPAWLLAEMALPTFNAYAGTELSLGWSAAWIALPLLGGVALGAGTLAGLYPALLVSAFRPVQALRGKPGVRGGAGFWRVLVVFQFSVSILFIGFTAVVRQQVEFMHARDLGLDKEQVIALTVTGIEGQRRPALMEQIARVPGVAAVARFRNMPSDRLWRWTDYPITPFGQAFSTGVDGTLLGVDPGFAELMGLKILAGGGFVAEARGDNVILNETAARRLGFGHPQEAVGQRIRVKGHISKQGATVRGVVADFHFESMHHAIGPVAIYNEQRPDALYYIGVRTEAGDTGATLARIEETWRRFAPEQRFVYQFLDEQYDQLYRREERLGRMLGAFSLLVIAVGCGGIFALAAAAVQRRTKEIGVRKVLGATATQIARMLSREFTWLIAVANIAAFPFVYWATRSWLADFAYRVSLGPGVFALGGILALLVAWFTVGGQVLRAARQNPVDALRHE